MFLTIAATIAVGYILLVAWVYTQQGGMLYYPSHEVWATPEQAGMAYSDLVLKTSDGVDISAWYVPVENARGTLIFCHGNAGNISHRVDSIRIFHALGLNVLIFDYRGYGKSGGRPGERGTYRDAEAAWDYAVNELKAEPGKIVLFGRSLGAAVAAELAKRKEGKSGKSEGAVTPGKSQGLSGGPGALIMESGFTSVPDLGSKFFPHLPVKLLSRFKYDTINKIDKITVPKLVIHSPYDEIVPYEQGVRVFEAAAEPKEFLKISGGHNDGFYVSGEKYIKGVVGFLDKWLGK